MLLDLIAKCLDHVHYDFDRIQVGVFADNLARDMILSIPFHLIKDIDTLARYGHISLNHTIPGRRVGGLLLMHPLYVAMRTKVVAPEVRAHFKECLAWIGKEMGIGQATLCASVSITSILFRYYG